jgi:type I restriction-modification system DNA methylase subunit
VAASSNSKKEAGRHLDGAALESWLWEAACTIRGPLDAPKFKDYILPLVFLKRLSDVFDDEIGHLASEFGDEKIAAKLVEQDHKLVRFFLPKKSRWSTIAEKTTGLGEALTDAVRAVARESPRLSGVIDVTDFNATAAGQRIVDDARLAALVQILNNPDYRLGLDDVEPDILGRAYEYLLRKFAEGQGQSGGERFTPTQVGIVMARILEPRPGNTVYTTTDAGRSFLSGQASSASDGKFNINTQILKKVMLTRPPIEEQQQIVQAVEGVQATLAAHQNRMQAQDDLFQTLLHDLMTGKVRVHDVPALAMKEPVMT